VSDAVYADGANAAAGQIIVDPVTAIKSATFTYTGAPQFYTVPVNVRKVFVRLAGGGSGGAGDVVKGFLPVTPGQVFQVNVGGAGYGAGVGICEPNNCFDPYHAGWNGGGTFNPAAGFPRGSMGGGGASDLRICANITSGGTCGLGDRLLVAAGGGGNFAPEW
jgi:hypothetical protein